MNLQQQERFYQVMTNSRSRAASLSSGKEVARVTELVNGLLVSKPKPEVIDLQEYAKSAACFCSRYQ